MNDLSYQLVYGIRLGENMLSLRARCERVIGKFDVIIKSVHTLLKITNNNLFLDKWTIFLLQQLLKQVDQSRQSTAGLKAAILDVDMQIYRSANFSSKQARQVGWS